MFSFPLFERLKAELPEFEELTAFQAGGGPRRPAAGRRAVAAAAAFEYVTGNYFSTLGINAVAGRVFSAADDGVASPVIALSYHAWQGAYGGDPSIIGASLIIEGRAFTVAGVTPPGFYGRRCAPIRRTCGFRSARAVDQRFVLAAPATGVGMAAGDRPTASRGDDRWDGRASHRHPAPVDPARLGISRQLDARDHPHAAAAGDHGRSCRLRRRDDAGSLRTGLRILLGVCVLVLLIACANVANLLLARAAARRGQTAIRLAMGASRRQIVTEALVERAARAGRGARRARRLGRRGAAAALAGVCRGDDRSDRHDAVADGAGIRGRTRDRHRHSVRGSAGVVCHPHRSIEALRGTGRTIGDRASFARKALLVVQATLSVVLVAGSTLLGRSLNNLEGQDFGFEIPDRVLVAIGRPPADYAPGTAHALYRDVEARLARLPGFAVPALRSTTR